jgi:protein-L-isoaspartate(D-aspartate) O-methyltransferase
MSDRLTERLALVHELAVRGIRDPRVLQAICSVPREEFVSPRLADQAYADRPLPIAAGQTISQPYVVAFMCEAIEPEARHRVLEIGTGSGYGAAVLAELVAEVHTIERIPILATSARERLQRLGYRNVQVHVGDGSLGWTDGEPYDAIVVTAGGPNVPAALRDQLKRGGRLVIPVGATRETQRLVRVTRRNDDTYAEDDLGGVVFVPLIGALAWDRTAQA